MGCLVSMASVFVSIRPRVIAHGTYYATSGSMPSSPASLSVPFQHRQAVGDSLGDHRRRHGGAMYWRIRRAVLACLMELGPRAESCWNFSDGASAARPIRDAI